METLAQLRAEICENLVHLRAPRDGHCDGQSTIEAIRTHAQAPRNGKDRAKAFARFEDAPDVNDMPLLDHDTTDGERVIE